jgi:hypothetical protein
MIILALAGEQLMHSFRRLGVHAWIASSNRRRIGRGRAGTSLYGRQQTTLGRSGSR